MTRIYSTILLLCISMAIYAQSIERVEPPFWWKGMKNTTLQIMVYGDNIAMQTPTIKEKGIELIRTETVQNENYLFLYLNIDPSFQKNTFKIKLKGNDAKENTINYELKNRERDSKDFKGFNNSDVLYLITPDRFCNGDPKNDNVNSLREKSDRANKGGRHGGDIKGIINSLPYISDLGFTSIWLNPLLENDMEKYSYHGYSTTDFYKVDPRFGTNEMYKSLSQNAKKEGLKLIMDMIVNHCGLFHWWMDDLPSANWINQWDTYTQTNHRKSVLQDPYVSEFDKKQFADGWFVPTMPDLNQKNKLLADYLIQNSIWWIEYLNLNGIRMDTYSYPDMNFMRDWTVAVMDEYPNFNIVGEEWYYQPSTVSYWQEGKTNPNGYTSELKSLMDFPVNFNLVKALKEKESFQTGWINLYEMIAQDFLYASSQDLVVFPDNHDMSRIYTQVNEDIDLFKMAIAFILTTRGTPQLYYGTEILMSNPGTTDHGIIRTDFPGGWTGDSINAFTNQGLSEKQIATKEFFKKILHWRKGQEVIHNGKLTHFVPHDKVYTYFRYDEKDVIMVILNKNEEAYSLDLNRFKEITGNRSIGIDILSEQKFKLDTNIELSKKGVLILELK